MSVEDRDTKFFEKFQKEELKHFSQYFDVSKLKDRIPSFEYLLNELNKLKGSCDEKSFQHVYQKKTLLKSLNAKKLCREGIPLQYMKTFLLKLFHVEFSPDDYANKCKFVFKGRQIGSLGNFVPLFTNKSFHESLPVHFLKPEGIEALKEILWLLNSVIPIIEYSPLIIKLTSLFLIFLSKEETYEIMRTLLEINLNPLEINKIRWHFRFTYTENLKISSSVNETIRSLSDDQTNKKLSALTYQCTSDKLIEDLSRSFFLDYLNFIGVLRFLPFFLYEGTKAIYRLSYALIKNIDVDKITKVEGQSPAEIMFSFKQKAVELRDIATLYKNSFELKLNRKNNKYLEQEVVDIKELLNKRNYYYLPSFSPPSKILSDENIISLWGLLPLEVKTFDGKLIYDVITSPKADLTTLYEMCEKNESTSVIIIIIETETGEVFGCIMNSNIIFSEEGHWIKPKNAHLYTIKPTVAVYSTKPIENEIVLFEPGALRFGNGKDGPAISISHDLKKGWTEEDTIFGKSKLLTSDSGDFSIKNMEIFLMV